MQEFVKQAASCLTYKTELTPVPSLPAYGGIFDFLREGDQVCRSRMPEGLVDKRGSVKQAVLPIRLPRRAPVRVDAVLDLQNRTHPQAPSLEKRGG